MRAIKFLSLLNGISLTCSQSSALRTQACKLNSNEIIFKQLLLQGKQSNLSARKFPYSTQSYGDLYSADHKMYLRNTVGDTISPFHDIPLFADEQKQVFNMVVEIPRWTNAKMEISTKDPMNPIKQDVKKGEVRFVHNCFPHKGYIWNYGAIPQTWEDPADIDEHTGQMGDGDPIDVIEIGSKVASMGQVKQVKLLGVLGLIDEGETDWKVLSIDVTDPLALRLNDVNDINTHMPGLLEATHDWFKIYKMPAGKPANQFAFDGDTKDRAFATAVVMHTHQHWKDLVEGNKPNQFNLSCVNINIDSSPHQVSAVQANSYTDDLTPAGEESALPDDVDKVHYVNRDSA